MSNVKRSADTPPPPFLTVIPGAAGIDHYVGGGLVPGEFYAFQLTRVNDDGAAEFKLVRVTGIAEAA